MADVTQMTAGTALADHPKRRQRSDAIRSREKLLRAVGELLDERSDFSLIDAATVAGVSTATAYRHFTSLDDAIGSYTAGFLAEVHKKIDQKAARGQPPSLHAVCQIWVESVLSWGKALVRLRSRHGYMQRLLEGDDDIVQETQVVEAQLRRLLQSEGLDDERLYYAIMVWNSLADPREVIDQHETLGWDVNTITQHLHTSVMAVAKELVWDAHLTAAHTDTHANESENNILTGSFSRKPRR
ncbi:MAG: TetR/AcrR family transcriptional regulator [Actinomycetia bacterium]|nr:TetR/AcrR family transcriptional regulator [Actinomycetes bacterium]